MKATLIILMYLLLNVFLAHSQSWEWINSAHGTDHDYSRSMAVDTEGNVYIVGTFSSNSLIFDSITLYNNDSSRDGYIVKYDQGGNIVWLIKIGGLGVDKMNQVAIDSQDNLYCMGIFSDSLTIDSQTIYGDNELNLFFTKFDSDRNIIWLMAFAGVSNFWPDYNICFDNTGDVYFAGSFHEDTLCFQGETIVSNGEIEIFIVKLNEEGDLIWLKNFGGEDNDVFRSLSFDKSGNLFFSGVLASSTVTFDTVVLINSGYNESRMGFIAKYSSEGELIQITNNQMYSWDDIAFDSDNNFYVSSYNFYWWVSEKIIISKFDDDFELIWEKQFSGFGFDYCNSIYVKNNDVYFTGMFDSDSIQFGDYVIYNMDSLQFHYYDGYAVKMNNTGEVAWAKHFGGEHIEYPYSIVVDNNGDVLISGFFWEDINFDSITKWSEGQCDVFVAKLDDDSNGIKINDSFPKFDVIIYPNPNQGSFMVNFINDVSGFVNIKVYSVNGKTVFENSKIMVSEQNEFSIQLPFYNSGIYFLEIEIGGETVSKKVIVN